MHRVTSLEFRQNFDLYRREALKSPLSVDHDGRDGIVVMSADEYARLKRRDRRAVAVEELSDAEIDAVRRAEPPPEAAEYDKELEHQHDIDG